MLVPQSHAREKLAALFWGDSTDEQARLSLRVALNNLRKQLAPNTILADRETVELNSTAALWCDAVELRLLLDAPHPETNLDRALALYRGELLADFYDDWVFPLRQALHESLVSVLLEQVELLRARGAYPEAITSAQQILALEPAHEQAHQHLIFCYGALGNRTAAAEQYRACVRVLAEELGIEPSAETERLYTAVMQRTEPASAAARLTNLPRPLTSFIGRASQVQELSELIAYARCVTLTGAGGTGKTRLAIQVGHAQYAAFADGVWFIDLSPLANPEQVPQAAARVLGIKEQAGQPLTATLIESLRDHTALLILDNCEHLITAAAYLVEALLTHCPDLRVLATSREALGIAGEQVYAVPTLAVPQADTTIADLLLKYEAIRLFVERARSVQPQFVLNDTTALAVKLICQRLDGIPLALELAAARAGTLTVEQIAARLDDRLNLLTQGSRTVLPRQQTLRALIDWSFDLLNPAEQTLFSRLSVFAGSWTLETADQITTDPQPELIAPPHRRRVSGPSPQFEDLHARLVEKSLIVADVTGMQARYTLLETIREYAHEKLAQAGEAPTIYTRHLAHFTKFAQETEPKLWSAEQVYWSDLHEQEQDNFRVALEWSLDNAPQKGLELAIALERFWTMHNHFRQARSILTELLERVDDNTDDLRGRGLAALGFMAFRLNETTDAKRYFEQALTLSAAANDAPTIAKSTRGLGLCEYVVANYAGALPLLERGRALYHELDDITRESISLNDLGEVARTSRQFEQAAAYYRASLDLIRKTGDRRAYVIILSNLGITASLRHDYAEALRILRETAPLYLEIGEKQNLVYVLSEIAVIWMTQGQAAQAVRLWGATETLRQQLNYRLFADDQTLYETRMADLRLEVPPDIFAREWEAGTRLTLAEAVALAVAP